MKLILVIFLHHASPYAIQTWKEHLNCEKKRLELIQLKKLGPEFSEKSHPKAIYTSRALSSLISMSSTSSINSFDVKQGMLYYIFNVLIIN